MAYDNKPVILKWDNDPKALEAGVSSFEALLDSACDRLWEKQVEISIQRIKEMDGILLDLEKELNEFIKLKANDQNL